jgi:hypothetical protein
MNAQNPFAHLDCCEAPKLVLVKILLDESHNDEMLMQCERCRQFWIKRFYERVDFVGGNDEITVWYSPVSDDEAQQIQQAQGRPDFSFLSERRSFMEDKDGIRVVAGQPTEPGLP